MSVVAGRISYNGKPIVALVDGEYSMLVFDSSGKQTEYARSIGVTDGESEVDFFEVTRVGLTLDEVKAFDVAVGNVVENVGEVTATDGLGAKWLASSPTGNAADDETLIDFDNGLQGIKITTKPDYQESTVELGGDFEAGSSITVTRNGAQVVISSNAGFFTYVSGTDEALSDSGVIPEWARPESGKRSNLYYILGSAPAVYRCVVDSAGQFSIIHQRTDTTANFSTTTSGIAPSISYTV